MILNLTILPGDGVGPEVTDEAVRVLETVAEAYNHQLSYTRKPVGGAALISSKDPLPADTLQACLSSGAVLLGAVGGPSFDSFPSHLRPESGLLRLRPGTRGICQFTAGGLLPGVWKTVRRCELKLCGEPTS